MSTASIEAGKGHVTLGVNDANLRTGLAAAQSVFSDFAKGAAVSVAAIGAAGASIMAPFMRGLSVFADWGKEMSSAMRETGIGFGQLDELMDGLRVGADELVPATAKMSAFLNAAASGSAEANAAITQLGLNFSELAMMSQGDRMMRFADALSRVGDAAQRIALTREIFGKGGLSLNLQGGAEGIRARAARADVVEGVRTEADLELARAYNRAIGEMNLATKGFWATIGSIAAGPLTEIYKGTVEYIIAARQWVEQNKEMLTVALKVGMGLVGVSMAFGFVASAAFGAAFVLGKVVAVAMAVGGAFFWIPNLVIASDVLKYSLLGVTGVLRLFGVEIRSLWEPLAVVDEMFDSIVVTVTELNGIAWAWVQTSPITQAIVGLAGIAAGVWAVHFAFNVLMVQMGGWAVLTAAYSVGASIAMLAWKVVMLGVNAVVALFNFNLAATNFIVGLFTAGTGGMSVGLLLAKVSAWLFNAALTAMNALLAPGVLIAAAATFGMIAVSLTVLGAAGYAAFGAAQALFSVLSTMPTSTGPIAAITAMFREWGTIIREVYTALGDDTQAAMTIMQGGFALAVSQIRDLWPPLWRFIQRGFDAVWDLMADTFKLKFLQAIAEAQRAFREMALEFLITAAIASNPVTQAGMAAASLVGEGDAFRGAIGSSIRSGLGWDADTTASGEAARLALETSMATARMRLEAASRAFVLTESPETAAAREGVATAISDADAGRWMRDLTTTMDRELGGSVGGAGSIERQAIRDTSPIQGGFGSLAALNVNGRMTMEERSLHEAEVARVARERQLEELRRITDTLLEIVDTVTLRVS